MAVGNAKSVAIKDACDHFGELFGANLNRNDALHFSSDKDVIQKRVDQILDSCETVEDVKKVRDQIPKDYQELADQLIEYMEAKDAEN